MISVKQRLIALSIICFMLFITATVVGAEGVNGEKAASVTTAAGENAVKPSAAVAKPPAKCGLSVVRVTGLKAAAGDNSITLTWDELSDIAGYRVFMYNTAAKKFKLVKTIESGSVNTYKATGLKRATEYRFKVRAFAVLPQSRKIYGEFSNIVSASTTLYTTSFKSVKSPAEDEISASWRKRSSASGYQLQYTTAKFNAYAKKITISKNTVTSRKLTGLYGGVNYKLRVRTFLKGKGSTKYGAWSKVMTIKPAASSAAKTESKLLNSVKLKPALTGYGKLDKLIKKLLGKLVTADMTTYEKTVAVFDYLSTDFAYGATGVYSAEHSAINKLGYKGKLDPVVVYDAYSFLMSKKGYCDDYSAAFCAMTRRIGLESYTIEGVLTRTNGDKVDGHNWSNIKINGDYYLFDAQAQTKVSKNLYYFCKPDGYFESFKYKNDRQWWYDNFKSFKID